MQWRFYIELLSGQDPSEPYSTHSRIFFAQTAMFYYNNISVRQAYISQLHKSFNRKNTIMHKTV